jgi:hypothetical protein
MRTIVFKNEKVVPFPVENPLHEQGQIHTVGTENREVEIRQVSSGFGEEQTAKIQMAA